MSVCRVTIYAAYRAAWLLSAPVVKPIEEKAKIQHHRIQLAMGNSWE